MGIRKAERLARGRREEAGEPVVTGASDGDPVSGFVQGGQVEVEVAITV